MAVTDPKNRYSYLTHGERGFIAGVMASSGSLDSARIIRYLKQGRLVGYRYRLQTKRHPEVVKALGSLLNVPTTKHDKGANITIGADVLDDLLPLIKKYLPPAVWAHYTELKRQSDMTRFNLIDQGWAQDGNDLSGPARHIYRGIDFSALDEYLALNPSDRHQVKKSLNHLNQGLI